LTDLGSCRAALASIKSWQLSVETECSFAPAKKTEIEETILRKD